MFLHKENPEMLMTDKPIEESGIWTLHVEMPMTKMTPMEESGIWRLHDHEEMPVTKKKVSGIWRLHEEQLIEILLKLPLKTMAICRSTCKIWYKILTHSRFLSLHHNIRLVESSPPPKLLFLSHNELHAIELLPDSTPVNIGRLDFPRPWLKSCKDQTSVVGPCNGILCLWNNKSTVSIWNPVTAKYSKLPSPPVRFPKKHSDKDLEMIMGFGYDPETEEYKIVLIVYVLRKDGEHDMISSQINVIVHTLGTSSWRTILDGPSRLFYISDHSRAVLVNGALHWTGVFRDGKHMSRFITSFSVKNEVFKEIPLPEFPFYPCDLNLGVLQGCLSVVPDFSYSVTDVWQMKEYGKVESCTRLCSINHLMFISLKPLFFHNDGELLVFKDGNERLVSYHLRCEMSVFSNVIERTPVNPFPYAERTPVNPFPYVETLAWVGSSVDLGTTSKTKKRKRKY